MRLGAQEWTGWNTKPTRPKPCPACKQVADAARRQWPEVVRLALLHRTGVLQVGDSAVIVVASAPHRRAAFEAASFCIDTLKQTVPIWKRERWSEGESWGLEAQHIEEVPG